MPLVECRTCGLKYVIHGLSEDQFKAFYDDPKYFDSEYAGGVEMNYEDNKAAMNEKAAVVLPIIKRYKPNGHFLDIGCAGGYLIELARDRFNYDARGVEVSKEMARKGRSRGLDILCGTVNDIPNSWPQFDIIYMGDVLEHIPRLKLFMEKVKGHMASDSFMVLELPLTFNLTLSGIFIGVFNMLKGNVGRRYFLPAQHRNRFEKKPPYHVLMFSRRSIAEFFRREGFTVRYMKIYEGKPKSKFKSTWYGRLKSITHRLTYYLPQNRLGDRMIVIAQKI